MHRQPAEQTELADGAIQFYVPVAREDLEQVVAPRDVAIDRPVDRDRAVRTRGVITVERDICLEIDIVAGR